MQRQCICIAINLNSGAHHHHLLPYLHPYLTTHPIIPPWVALNTLVALWLQEAVQQYGAVFSWLLCLKRVSLLMRNLWLDLAACARWWSSQASSRGSEAQGASMGAVVQQRLRILQLFRHQAAHLVAALQAYMQGQLLGTCWHQLQSLVTVSCSTGRA